MVDPVIGFLKLHSISNKKSFTVSHKVDSQWFCRYLCPYHCIYDNGNEFLGHKFLLLLKSYGVHPSATTVRNP